MSNNHLIRTLTFLLTIISSNVDASKSSYEYYAMMAGVISPFLEYHPILPLKENELIGASYYRVMKNENNQLYEKDVINHIHKHD